MYSTLFPYEEITKNGVSPSPNFDELTLVLKIVVSRRHARILLLIKSALVQLCVNFFEFSDDLVKLFLVRVVRRGGFCHLSFQIAER